jgi:kinetochore protein Nuf2
MADCEDLVQQTDQNAIKLRELAQEIDELKNKIVELEQINSGYDGKLNSIQQHNNKVEDELRRLKKIQEQLASEHVQDKQEKQRLVKKLEDDNFLIIETRKENDKMRPYVVEAPDMLHKINNDMNESLQQEKSLLGLKEKQIREYEISTDSIRLIDQEIKSCLKALEEIEAEVQRRDENVRKLNKFQELHDQRKLDSKDLDRKIQQLRRQTSVSGERVERAAMQRDQKNEQAKQRMTELYELHAKLMAERDISKQEVTKKKMYIEQAEMQMEEIKQTFEVEVKQTTKEAERLQTHINMYLNEMERRLAEHY